MKMLSGHRILNNIILAVISNSIIWIKKTM